MALKTLKRGIWTSPVGRGIFAEGSTLAMATSHPPFYDALARWPSKWCVRRVRVALKRAMSNLSRRLQRLDSRRVCLPHAIQRECFSARDPNRCVLVSFRLRRACKPSGARYVTSIESTGEYSLRAFASSSERSRGFDGAAPDVLHIGNLRR